jgi:drug/metabolite transporter (DMT)-like permease
MKTKKAIYTLFAASPFILIAIFVAQAYLPMVRAALDEMSTWGELLFIGFFLGALLAVIWDVWRNPRMPAQKRKLWTAVLLLGNWYALPFYWWFYIRGSPDDPDSNRNT